MKKNASSSEKGARHSGIPPLSFRRFNSVGLFSPPVCFSSWAHPWAAFFPTPIHTRIAMERWFTIHSCALTTLALQSRWARITPRLPRLKSKGYRMGLAILIGLLFSQAVYSQSYRANPGAILSCFAGGPLSAPVTATVALSHGAPQWRLNINSFITQ